MKSQKISNRAPRPFKTKADRWSGGGQTGFIPSSKPAVKPVKAAAKPAAEKPADKAADEK